MLRDKGYLTGLLIVITALLGATTAQAAFMVGYDYYVYATGGDAAPIADDASLNNQTFTSGLVTQTGEATAGNFAHVEYLANLATGTLLARAVGVGGVSGVWPYGYTATGRMESIRMEDQLTFRVPAGTYPDGVTVELSGQVFGQVSATFAASAQVNFRVSWGGLLLDPGLISIGNDDDTVLLIDESISLAKQIVAPGTPLEADQEYLVDFKAHIANAIASTIRTGTSPDYVVGSSEIDFLSGIRITDVITPVGVTWSSDSGVFLDRPSETPDVVSPVPVCTLLPNFPNPFNPTTTIAFETAAAGRVSLCIFDLRGHLVATLMDREITAGRHEAVWRGRDDRDRRVPSGTYLCRLTAGGASRTRSLTLVE